CFVVFLLHFILKRDIFHCIEMKDRVAQLTASRKQLRQQMPDLSTVLPGSLLSRMVRCNKPGCRFCEKGKGKGHGPIWILSVSLGSRQVRQIPVPSEPKKEVEESLRAFAPMHNVAKQNAQVNLELFKQSRRPVAKQLRASCTDDKGRPAGPWRLLWQPAKAGCQRAVGSGCPYAGNRESDPRVGSSRNRE